MNYPLVVNQLAKLVLVLTMVLAIVAMWSGLMFLFGETSSKRIRIQFSSGTKMLIHSKIIFDPSHHMKMDLSW